MLGLECDVEREIKEVSLTEAVGSNNVETTTSPAAVQYVFSCRLCAISSAQRHSRLRAEEEDELVILRIVELVHELLALAC